MKIIETKNRLIFRSRDNRGEFEFRILKDLSQIQLEAVINEFPDSEYIDTDRREVTMIRDILNRALGEERLPLGIHEARELVNQMLAEEISFSRFVELINQGGRNEEISN